MTKEHKKMYKAGKYWAVATLVSASILMGVGVTTHADAVEDNKYDGTANINIDYQANVDGKIISANQNINALWSQYQQALQEREDAWEQGQGNRFSPAYMTADAKAGATYQEWLRAQTRLGDDLHNYDVAQWQREQDKQQANQPSQQPQQTQQVTTTQTSQSSSDQPQTEVTKTGQPNQTSQSSSDQPQTEVTKTGQPNQPNIGQPNQPNIGQPNQPNIGQPNQPNKPAGKTSFDSENSSVISGYTFKEVQGDPSQPSNTNNGAINSSELPQTGENNSQSQIMSFIGILVVILLVFWW